jgi:hypothetical protein
MIKNLLVIALLTGATASFAQTAKTNETCLEQYQKQFKERGAASIEDGNHKVIISVTTEMGTDCYEGKAKVESGSVSAIYMVYEDGTSEFLDRKYKGTSKPKIVNGISESLSTTDGETIQVVFVTKIMPKKKQFKKASGPGKDF